MADGSLVCGGGKVVKNVAGYDLPKLYSASFGTVGIIVEATVNSARAQRPTTSMTRAYFMAA